MQGEKGYLDLLKTVLEKGDKRTDRTNTGTISIFAPLPLKFDLSNCEIKQDGTMEIKDFPLLTTKRVPWKSCIKELLWFLSGSTDATLLQKQGVKIWDGNTSREFLDKVGMQHWPEGSLGYGYGHQWRSFGGTMDPKTGETLIKGVDQVQNCVDLIRNNPTSRRILFSAWNPLQMNETALPPCHILAQFYVESDRLHCQMYQR